MASSSKRERELARMRAMRQAERRAAAEEARLRRRNSILAGASALAVVAVIVLIAYATKDGKKTVRLGSDATCAYTASGAASKKVEGGTPEKSQSAKGKLTATLATSQGDLELSLDRTTAPCTVGSWGFLAQQGYFDATDCHRLTTSGIFVLQCGDPTGSGSGGPGYGMPEENLTAFGAADAQGQVIYPRGTIAMARTQTPGSGGSQFFLVYKDSPLAPDYTPFGTITGGLDVLDKVAKAGSTPASDGKPNLPVTITKVSLS